MQPHLLHVSLSLLLPLIQQAYGNPLPQIEQTASYSASPSTLALQNTTSTVDTTSAITDINGSSPVDTLAIQNAIGNISSVDDSLSTSEADLSVPRRSASCDSVTPARLGVQPKQLRSLCEHSLRSIIKILPNQLLSPVALSADPEGRPPFGTLPMLWETYGDLVPGVGGMWKGCTIVISFQSPFQTGSDITTKKEIMDAAYGIMDGCIDAFNRNGGEIIGRRRTARIRVETGLIGRVSPARWSGEYQGGNESDVVVRHGYPNDTSLEVAVGTVQTS